MGCSFSSPYIAEGATSYAFAGNLATQQVSFGVAGTLVGSSVANNTRGCAAYSIIKPTAIVANYTYSCSDIAVPTDLSSSVQLLCDLPHTKLTGGLLTVNYNAGRFSTLLQQQIFTVTQGPSLTTNLISSSSTFTVTSGISTSTGLPSSSVSLTSGDASAITQSSSEGLISITHTSSGGLNSIPTGSVPLTNLASQPVSVPMTSSTDFAQEFTANPMVSSTSLDTGSASKSDIGLQSSVAGIVESPSRSELADLTTSTVFSTTVYTTTTCPQSVTDCPARLREVVYVTELVPLYVTVCPASAQPMETGNSRLVSTEAAWFSTQWVASLSTYSTTFASLQHSVISSGSSSRVEQSSDGTSESYTQVDVKDASLTQNSDAFLSHSSDNLLGSSSQTVVDFAPSVQQYPAAFTLQSITDVAPMATRLTITITTTTYLPFSACSSICQNNAARPALKARQIGGYITTSIRGSNTKVFAGPVYTYNAFSTAASTASSSLATISSTSSKTMVSQSSPASLFHSSTPGALNSTAALTIPVSTGSLSSGFTTRGPESTAALHNSTVEDLPPQPLTTTLHNSTNVTFSATISADSSHVTHSSSTVVGLGTTSAILIATSSAAVSMCSSDPVATLSPVANADLIRSDLSILKPSRTAILNYAQSNSGNSGASIKFDMIYLQVTLEDSSYISHTICSESQLVIKLTQDGGSLGVISKWPTSGLVLVTNSESCNSGNERGVYMVDGFIIDEAALEIMVEVTRTEWRNVAVSMDVTYGTITDGSALARPSQCSSSYSVVTISAPTPTAPANSTLEVPPELQRFFDDLKSKMHHNPDGSIQLYPREYSAPFEITTPTWQPDNSTLQDALEAALQEAGLGKPADLAKKASDALVGVCTPPPSASSITSRSALPLLDRRDDDDDDGVIDKYLCNDIVGAFTGDYGELACGINNLARHGDTLKCLFVECTHQVAVTQHIYTHTFKQDWSGSIGLIPGADVISWSDGSKLTCINCGLSLASFKIAGTVQYIFETSALRAATLTISEDSTTNMLYHLDAKRSMARDWNTAVDTGDMESVEVAGVFKITPSVIFSMGVDFSTDSAVDVEGGAVLSLTGAGVDFDMSTLSTSNSHNWDPRLDMTIPTFKTASKVKMIPYIRRLIDIKFSVMGKSQNSLQFSTLAGLGFNSELVESAGDVCTPEQLALKSTVFSTNKFSFGDASSRAANSRVFSDLSVTNPVKCFDVPSKKPTREEIASLRAVGQEFCTAYNRYVPSVSGLYLASTLTTLSYTTSTTTSTITTIPTATETTSILSTKTRVVQTSAYFLTGSGTQHFPTSSLEARNIAQPTPPPTSTLATQVDKRQNTYPTMVADWEPSKIKYACSQIATGIQTSTFYTSTLTLYSSVETITATSWTNTDAVASTTTSTLTGYTWTTTTSITATSTIPASCPLQTQTSCFHIIGHGSPQIEGKQLGVKDGVLNPSFDYSPSTFYLTCEGSLVSLPDTRVLTGPFGANKLSFSSDSQAAASCTRNSVTKQLTCSQDGSNIMYIWQPNIDTAYWTEPYIEVAAREDADLWAPAWGPRGSPNEYQPLILSTVDVPCSCADPTSQKDLIPMDTTFISCPASDNTRYTSSDGSEWQIRCSTDYQDTSMNTVSTSSLATCVAKCEALGGCFGAAWTPASQECALKGSMLSESYSTGDLVHSFIRLFKLPAPSNVLYNPQLEGDGIIWGWDNEGRLTTVGCSWVEAFNDPNYPDCSLPQNMRQETYAELFMDEDNNLLYSSISQEVTLIPGYEYRFSLKTGYSNGARNCALKYALDDDVFWSLIPESRGAWTDEGPYAITAKESSQRLKISYACPSQSGSARFAQPNLIGPYEIQ
jgi:hypothetical protein